MPWVSTRSQTSCAPLASPHHPFRSLCRRHPEAFWGPPALQIRLKRNRLLGLERWGRDSKAGIGAARVHAVQARICPDTRTPTHTHSYFQLPSRPSCLNFPLFPRGSPDLWHGGASHGAAAREERQRAPYKPVPALLPISSPKV